MGARTLEAWSRRLKPSRKGPSGKGPGGKGPGGKGPGGKGPGGKGPGGKELGGKGIPRLWLLSDPRRLPDPLPAAARLPRGAGVLARGLAADVLARLARLCRARGLVLLVGGDGRTALRHRAGLHLPDRAPAAGLLPFLRAGRGRLLSVAVHGRAGMARGRRLRADLAFLSPAFPTESHPGAPALGPLRWAGLARRLGRPAVALGGVGPATAGRLPRRGAGRAYGLAAIGALASG